MPHLNNTGFIRSRESTRTMDIASPTQLLKPAEVQRRTTLDRVTIWRKVRAGTFPQPLKISDNRIAWRESDIETFIAACGTTAGPADSSAAA